MKVSVNWIREYVDLPADLTIEQLTHDLTMRTVKIKEAKNLADSVKNVVVGKIREVNSHSQADQLRVCLVDIGKAEPSTIVCGGANLAPEQLVVVAVPGSFVKWHGEGELVEIKTTNLRGVKSEGMICAASELGMEEVFPAGAEREILDLTGWDVKPGDLVSEVLQLNDIILEIDNQSIVKRPDLWGHYGIARELAAIYRKELRTLPVLEVPAGAQSFPVAIEDEKRCLRLAAMVYEGLKSELSPYWLCLKLWKVGVRPINSIVDITNYVMMAVGQPTHGFDKKYVRGGIVVRPAKDNEKLELLNGQVLSLAAEDLLICNASEPVSLAGVMGGKHSSILPETSEMVLEVANFHPLYVRRSARRFGLCTEASARMEKGIDTQRIDQAMGVADRIIREIHPGARLVGYKDCYPVKTEQPVIEVTMDFLTARLGRELSPEVVATSLRPLGFKTSYQGGVLRVDVPSWRGTGDVSLPDDILGEVARMIGYENFRFIPPTITLDRAVGQRGVEVERAIREYLAYRAGLQEIFTYPWIDEKYIKAAGIPLDECLALATPPTPETAHLRSSLIPGMMESIVTNVRYFNAFRIFELTQVFHQGATHLSRESEPLPRQERSLAAAFVGTDAATLFREAKGILEMLPRITQIEAVSYGQTEKPAWADNKVWLNIMAGDAVIGSLGVLSIKAARMAGIKRVHAVLCELNVEKLRPLAARENKFEPLPLLPLVELDISFLIDETVKWREIEDLVSGMVRRREFVEEYRGKQVPEGKKSVLLRVWLASDEKTLTAEEIEQKMNGVLEKIGEKLGGEIRG